VEANQGLVVMMARKRLDQGLALADLVQEGSIGLMHAADRFDHRRGFRFSTYAAWWIRHALNRALSDQSRTIRIPVHMLETQHKLRRRTSVLELRTGERPPESLMLEEMQIGPTKLARVRAIPKQPRSLDAPIGLEGDRRLGDTIADERTPSPLDELSLARAGAELRKILGILTPREQEVLCLRFGMGRSEELTLAQVGERFSLSRERVRQIEFEALNKLRRAAEARHLDVDADIAS
jgi:RNA polymerase primary sigma factor